MTDKKIDEEEKPDEEIDDEVDETGTKSADDKEKIFTQKDVNRFIQREKAKYKLYKEELDTLKTGKDETLTKYEDTIQKMVDGMTAEVPDSIKLLLSKLTPLEQLDYLNNPENNVVFEKKQFPISKEKGKNSQTEFKPTPVEKFM